MKASPGKRVAIIQSFYIPWKGYFDIINSVDEFILLDDVQYQRRSWINRNIIKTKQGLRWLTISVKVKGRYQQHIRETEADNSDWKSRHWETIKRNYSKAACFKQHEERFADLYLNCTETHISRINYRFISAVCDILGIKTNISSSADFDLVDGKNERLIHLCRQAGAEVYLSGPAAKDYIDEELFKAAGIELQYMDYSGYPEYKQLYPPFVHEVSIIDLIFNQGIDARLYMKSFQPQSIS